MYYHKIEKNSIANGTGVRCVLWCSGCLLHCKGCQNPHTWSFNSGAPFDKEVLQELYEALDKSYIQGLTLSGGNPMDNIPEILHICRTVKEKFPTKDIWIYSGYTFEQLQQSQAAMCVLEYVDVLVDGPYIEEQRDITLPWRGSRNQRVIDVQKTLEQGRVITLVD